LGASNSLEPLQSANVQNMFGPASQLNSSCQLTTVVADPGADADAAPACKTMF